MSEIEKTGLEPQAYTGQESWKELTADADEVLGYELAKDELLDALVGVPFIITQLSFRPGITRKTEQGDKQFAFVSIECVIAPASELRIAKINVARKTAGLPSIESLADLPFGPDDHVIFNDGSTGIYRQIVQYLATKKYITLVKEGQEVISNGRIGETSLDLPPGDWHDVHAGHMRFDLDRFGIYTVHVRLLCPRGLRLSKYQNEYNPDGSKTRYIA